MRPCLLLPVLAALFLASCVSGPKRHFALERIHPDSLKTYKFDVDAYKEKYDGHDGVFISADHVLEHVAAAQVWNAYRVSTLRFMVLNPDAEWLTTFSVGPDKGGKLLRAYVNVISPDGSVRSFTEQDMKLEEDSDGNTVYRFAYPDVQVGTVVDEGYEIRYPSGAWVAREDFPLQYHLPCEQVRVRFACPNWFTTRTKKIGPDERIEAQPDHSVMGVKGIVYEAKDVPAVADEPYSPNFKEMSRYLDVAVTGVHSTMFLRSWDHFAEGFKEYALDRESFWRDRAGSVLDDIVTDDMTDLQKTDVIISWLQQNIAIEEVPADFSFNDVIKRKKGNSILVTGLARLMLEKVGLDADFLLIHSAEQGYFDEDYVTFGTLTVPAVRTMVDEEEYVLFPYIKNLPIDLVPEYVQGQRAIRINGDGFVTMPEGNLARNTITESYHLKIDDEGLISVSEEKELRGSAAYSVRRLLEKVKEEEIEELMRELLTYEEGDVELKKYDIENRDDYHKPLKVRLEYEIDNLVTITPDEVIVQTAGLLSPSSNRKTKVETEKRVNPIRVYYTERLVRNITIDHPDAWRLSTLPENIAIENDFGSIDAEYSTADGQVRIALSRTLNNIKASADKFPDMLHIIGSRSRYLQVPTLIFSNTGFEG